MKRFIVIVLLLATNLFALPPENDTSPEKNSTKKESILEAVKDKEPSIYKKLLSLDYIQKNISDKILIFSSKLDHTVKEWVKDDTNTSSEELIQSIEE